MEVAGRARNVNEISPEDVLIYKSAEDKFGHISNSSKHPGRIYTETIYPSQTGNWPQMEKLSPYL